ncbi:anthranilate synthase component I family protein [Algoriphagus vanfongensis]|uniref:anthranilate synthase component I family protein n=1 Tax=Algoriphagus vanfongensis TaxID=426371 RepID=UPI0003FF2692|nr:anthranilate synthase component I family protein [Algoriphagus vanfongensis]
MIERQHSYQLTSPSALTQVVEWVNLTYPFFCLTTGHQQDYPRGTFPDQILAGNKELTQEDLWKSTKNKLAGIISYDYKNQLEKLSSGNPSLVKVPDLTFFEAELIITFSSEQIQSNLPLPDHLWSGTSSSQTETKVTLQALTTKKNYLETFHRIQDQIVQGNTYEMNYCIAMAGEIQQLQPVAAFFNLMNLSPMPFSALFKANDKYLISASPERFLKKIGSQLIAQPIKGTARRSANTEQDEANKKNLLASEKERAENLMITDLMRNDLSKVSKTGSVEVPELFGLYSFPKVHQMISTVQSQLQDNISLRDIIQASFPMGSMTGAPKIKTMELIDQLENFQRGWFSGSLMLIDETGDFDSSVIIRSIIVDQRQNKLYFGVGSAVTIDADAEAEYEECLLKASAILEVLSGK